MILHASQESAGTPLHPEPEEEFGRTVTAAAELHQAVRAQKRLQEKQLAGGAALSPSDGCEARPEETFAMIAKCGTPVRPAMYGALAGRLWAKVPVRPAAKA